LEQHVTCIFSVQEKANQENGLRQQPEGEIPLSVVFIGLHGVMFQYMH
jgi:hypothetical protein